MEVCEVFIHQAAERNLKAFAFHQDAELEQRTASQVQLLHL